MRRTTAYALAAALWAAPVLGQHVVTSPPLPERTEPASYMLAYQESTEAWQKNTFSLFSLYGAVSGKIRDAFNKPDPNKIYPLIVRDPIVELDNPDMVTLVDVVDKALDERKYLDARLAYQYPDDKRALERALRDETVPLGDFGMLEDMVAVPEGGDFVEYEGSVMHRSKAQVIFFWFMLGDKRYDGRVIRPLNERIPIRLDEHGNESDDGDIYGYRSEYSKNKAVIQVSRNGKDWKSIKNPMLDALADEVTGEDRMRAIMQQKLKDAMKSDMPQGISH